MSNPEIILYVTGCVFIYLFGLLLVDNHASIQFIHVFYHNVKKVLFVHSNDNLRIINVHSIIWNTCSVDNIGGSPGERRRYAHTHTYTHAIITFGMYYSGVFDVAYFSGLTCSPKRPR
jgi:hypothetical protein